MLFRSDFLCIILILIKVSQLINNYCEGSCLDHGIVPITCEIY